IFRMRLPAMSLKNTLPAASTAGPSRKQTTAAGAAAVCFATNPSGSAAFDRSWAAQKQQPGPSSATSGRRARGARGHTVAMTTLLGGAGGNGSLLQRLVEELEQRRRRRVVGLAEVLIDLGVGRLLGAEERGGDACVSQHVAQALCLRGRVGVGGDVQEQEG